MKKLLSFSIALLSITTLVACSGHKAESKVPEEKIEQKQIKFDENGDVDKQFVKVTIKDGKFVKMD